MKTILLIAVSFMLVGCSTLKNEDGTIPVETQQSAAIVLRNAARGAAAVAIDENKDNAKHVQLAVVVLDQFLVSDDHSPGALVKALAPTVKEVRDVKIALAINTVTDLYEAFYGRYVRGKVAQNETATLFLTALRDGAKQGLELNRNSVIQ